MNMRIIFIMTDLMMTVSVTQCQIMICHFDIVNKSVVPAVNVKKTKDQFKNYGIRMKFKNVGKE